MTSDGPPMRSAAAPSASEIAAVKASAEAELDALAKRRGELLRTGAPAAAIDNCDRRAAELCALLAHIEDLEAAMASGDAATVQNALCGFVNIIQEAKEIVTERRKERPSVNAGCQLEGSKTLH